MFDVFDNSISVKLEDPTAHFSRNVLHNLLIMKRSDDQLKGESISMWLHFAEVQIFQILFLPLNWVFMFVNSPQ